MAREEAASVSESTLVGGSSIHPYRLAAQSRETRVPKAACIDSGRGYVPDCRGEEGRETNDDRNGCQRQTSTGPLRVARLWDGKSSHIIVPAESLNLQCPECDLCQVLLSVPQLVL